MILSGPVLAIATDAVALQRMAARFAPTEVSAPLSGLPAGERAALARIVEAARLMDTLYLRQVWSGNEPLLLQLSQDATPLGRAPLHLFLLDRLAAVPVDIEPRFTAADRLTSGEAR